MTVYIIRRADGTVIAVEPPEGPHGMTFSVCAVLNDIEDAGDRLLGTCQVPTLASYLATIRAERDEARAWADVDRAATRAAQDLRRAARRAVARYRARKAEASANTREGNHD